MAEFIVHAKCGKKWTGLGKHHCSACHQTFSSIGSFTKHRVFDKFGEWHCADPEEVGLVDSGYDYVCWRLPVDESNAEWFKKLREKADEDAVDTED